MATRFNFDRHVALIGLRGALHNNPPRDEAAVMQFHEELDAIASLPEIIDDGEPDPKVLAWQVWQKTNGHCTYCDRHLNPFDRMAPNGFQIEHSNPKSQGGSNELDNLVPSCTTCNKAKAGQTPDQWGGPNV